jgi:hypothetical protein
MGTVRHAPPGCAQGVLTSMRRGFACSALGMCSFSTPSASSAVAFSVSSSEVSGKTERVRPRHQRQGHRRRSGRDPDVSRVRTVLCNKGRGRSKPKRSRSTPRLTSACRRPPVDIRPRRHFRVPGGPWQAGKPDAGGPNKGRECDVQEPSHLFEQLKTTAAQSATRPGSSCCACWKGCAKSPIWERSKP